MLMRLCWAPNFRGFVFVGLSGLTFLGANGRACRGFRVSGSSTRAPKPFLWDLCGWIGCGSPLPKNQGANFRGFKFRDYRV